MMKSAVQTVKRETSGLANTLGLKLRGYREAASISVRELARRIDVSPSLISQIEHGRVTPSVDTLYRLANELELSVDKFFVEDDRPIAVVSSGAAPAAGRLMQRRQTRKKIQLAGGVTWERLTPAPDDEVEFLHVIYQVGSESCVPDSMLRHGGKEYACVLSGRLGMTIGFEEYELGPGDSIAFDANHPHRIFTIGNEPATAVWVVLNRESDIRTFGG